MDDEKTATRTRNRRGEGSRLRDEIVAAAVELLDETGDASAVTLRSVARHIGIAAPSIYRHFPDQPAIVLAAVQHAFAELDVELRAARDTATGPRQRLFAICDTYLAFAEAHPGRYRTMFGGLWMPDLTESSVTETDLSTLGRASIDLLRDALADCVDTGAATSTDIAADTVALWLGLHGLAHQRAVAPNFVWPPDIAERVVSSLAHLTGTQA
ncbi:TetR/AcrR family transcriptional regulator [Amycolatopsis sp., V23-08]|uniref:TetR/AcrR family transcriptional regulator n=1 Tax=Amycolatopsis heterodermiae TaxID=3110235 RepID=A0ABU5R6C7_9PSEU|nr:TetR/AcrR family transcriptional regulator [Amycolatopsis sp., V23-08]MEA5360831.1 TetR/AcrR family transcriptional regulator [Amycolatopsis sp., V23-08]